MSSPYSIFRHLFSVLIERSRTFMMKIREKIFIFLKLFDCH
ncbi:unnamed protein product [Paramecium primaurelia]|uniref:Uncharacterized protein n=1 Tax=Paramecium primaurelia TaxID=5886 RepID=A0A8S1PQ32_PARPR|nr:unnamed protein product [Paramecium primaurelia]